MSTPPTNPPEDPEELQDAQEPDAPGEQTENEGRDLDEAFDAIVAGIRHGERPPHVPHWPVAEDDDSPEPVASGSATVEPPKGSQWSGWEDLAAARVEEPEPAEPGDDEHYVPPPPPPVPQGDPLVRWAWAGAVGSPVLGIALPALGWELDGLTGLVLVSAFLGGFVTLIARLRTGPRADDDPDNGAVV